MLCKRENSIRCTQNMKTFPQSKNPYQRPSYSWISHKRVCTAIYLDAKFCENRHTFRPKSQFFADFFVKSNCAKLDYKSTKRHNLALIGLNFRNIREVISGNTAIRDPRLHSIARDASRRFPLCLSLHTKIFSWYIYPGFLDTFQDLHYKSSNQPCVQFAHTQKPFCYIHF